MADSALAKDEIAEAVASADGYSVVCSVFVASPEAKLVCRPKYPAAKSRHQAIAMGRNFLTICPHSFIHPQNQRG